MIRDYFDSLSNADLIAWVVIATVFGGAAGALMVLGSWATVVRLFHG